MDPMEESIKKLASWDEIDIAFAMFYQFLADLSIETNHGRIQPVYHVVFSFGTVIRIDVNTLNALNTHKLPRTLTPEYMESWPIERLSDMTTAEVYKNAVCTYETQICLEGEEGLALWLAFDALIHHGYPTIFESPVVSHAGCDGDPPTANLYSVEFSNGIDCTSNLVTDDMTNPDAIVYAHIAADLRQLDYMFPCVYAVITPKNEIIKFV